jgi:hypothetical protein
MNAPLPIVWIASSLRAALRDLRSCVHVRPGRGVEHDVAIEQIYALLDELERHGEAVRKVKAAND